jgi:hypothetical protein
LGSLGGALAVSLRRAGFDLIVHDIDHKAAKPLLMAGAVWAESPRALAGRVDAVDTCLPFPTVSERVLTGPDGVLATLEPGSTWIEMGADDSDSIQRLAAVAAEKRVFTLEAAYEVIKASSGASFVHETESQLVLNGSYNVGFTMELACKDLGFAMALGREFGCLRSRPPRLARISASPAAMRWIKASMLVIAFITEAEPRGPTWKIGPPIAAHGLARGRVSGGAEGVGVTSPSSEIGPPEPSGCGTGAKSMPTFCKTCP